jgi:hypothetical protein
VIVSNAGQLGNGSRMGPQQCLDLVNQLNNLLSIRRTHPQEPLFDTDYHCLTQLCMMWRDDCSSNKNGDADDHHDLIQDLLTLWNVSDMLLDSAYSGLWYTMDSAKYVFVMHT